MFCFKGLVLVISEEHNVAVARFSMILRKFVKCFELTVYIYIYLYIDYI
jgi:hypothetical protein